MRQDTEEIAELFDKTADLTEKKKLVEALRSLVHLEKLIAQWVERHLHV